MGKNTQAKPAADADTAAADAAAAEAAEAEAQANADAEAEAAAVAAAEQPAKVEARVLADGVFGKVDDVVSVSAEVAKAHSELDAHPDAVAYAKALKQG